MAKCQHLSSCNENGKISPIYRAEGKTVILCDYHEREVIETLRRQRQLNSGGSNEVVKCPHCYFDGRFNKRTQECNEPLCRYYPRNCKHCQKKIKPNDAVFGDRSKRIWFCSQLHGEQYWLEKDKNKLENLERQIKEKNNEMAKILGQAIEKGEDISNMNWESADWLNEEQKEACRNYVKKCKEIEDLKKQKGEVSSSNLCDKCGQNSNDFYSVGGKGNYCRSCAEEVAKPNNNQSSNSPSPTIQPTSGSDSSDGNNNTNSPSQPGSSNSPSNNSPSDNSNGNDNSGNSSNSPNSQNDKPKPKLFLIIGTKKEVMDYAKKLIDQGNKVEDIDLSPLNESEKTELNNYWKNNSSSKQNSNEKPFSNKNSWATSKIILVIGILVLLIITAVVVAKRKKKRKLRSG